MLPLRAGVVGGRVVGKRAGARVLPASCSASASASPSCLSAAAAARESGARGGLRLGSGPLRARVSTVPCGATLDGESGLSSGEEVFDPVSAAEHEANERRRQEAAELRAQQQNGAEEDDDDEADPFVGLGDWRWSLNWDEITSSIFVGACPRRPKDVETIYAKTGCTAVLCLQSHSCFEALGIDHGAIRARGGDIGVKVIHVPIRDFDHGSQAEMIPEAVRILSTLLKTGHKVYVHCTAGINRATLTVLSYLTFVEGMSLDAAYDFIKSRRPQAHPYLDCWWTARARFLQGKSEDLTVRSQKIYEARCYACEPGTTGEDWFRAESELIQDIYRNRWECDRSVMAAWQATADSDVEKAKRELEAERQKCQALASKLQSSSFVQSELEATRMEVNTLKEELFLVVEKLRALQEKEEELDLLKLELESERAQVRELNSELHPLRRNLNEAWVELQRKEQLETDMKNAEKQMVAMKNAFEVLHSNLNRSCETISNTAAATGNGVERRVENGMAKSLKPPRQQAQGRSGGSSSGRVGRGLDAKKANNDNNNNSNTSSGSNGHNPSSNGHHRIQLLQDGNRLDM